MSLKGVKSATRFIVSDGSELQVCGAAVENARRVYSVPVLRTDSSGASDDHTDRTVTAGCIRSLRYAGVEDEGTLNVGVVSCTRRQDWRISLRVEIPRIGLHLTIIAAKVSKDLSEDCVYCVYRRPTFWRYSCLCYTLLNHAFCVYSWALFQWRSPHRMHHIGTVAIYMSHVPWSARLCVRVGHTGNVINCDKSID